MSREQTPPSNEPDRELTDDELDAVVGGTTTGSGIRVTFDDDETTGTATKSITTRSPSAIRTRSGIRMDFYDDAS